MTVRPLFTTLLLCALCAGVRSQDLAPRRVLDPGPARAAPVPAGPEDSVARRLIVKFADDVLARADDDGGVRSASARDLSAARELAAGFGGRFTPLIRLPPERLDALQDRAATRSGRAQPDLAGMLVIDGLSSEPAFLEQVGEAFRALSSVEFVHIETLGVPPPTDIAPATPDLSSNQNAYFAAVSGMDVDWAWQQGYRGAGIRVSDCEYGWNPAHEDLNDIDIHQEPGQTIAAGVFSNGWDAHGTAVLGELVAVDNGYGVNGMSTDATPYSYTEWSEEEGFRRVTCVTNAIADSGAGDVVLLEMQDFGAGGGMAPAEVNPALFAVVLVGTDADVIVVAAAGNGAQDLDSVPYQSYLAMGDSGAIIVGAGTSNPLHNTLSFSTFGERVNLQGWGEFVFTLGYGDGGLFQYGGDKNQRYTAQFSGTSSASPFVAAACLIVQQAAEQILGKRLTPLEMRQLLVDSGTPQGTGGHIGPLPDVRAAIQSLVPPPTGVWVDVAGGTVGQNGVPSLVMTGTQTPLSLLQISITGAPPSNLLLLWISLTSTPVSAFGGTIHAFPFSDQVLLGTDGTGAFSADSFWPLGVPSGTHAWWQVLVEDPSVVWGITLSNGIQSIAP